MLLIIVAVLMSIVAVLAVAYPVLAQMGERGPTTSSAEDTLEELLAERDATFQAIRDLKFDHQIGKITDEDFMVFEANLKESAANALRTLDRWESETDSEVDLVLERAVAARRAALGTPGLACSNCGRPSAAGDTFCAGCGESIVQTPSTTPQKPALTCPHCGRLNEVEDRFCTGCGQPLSKREAVAR
jgi:Double zinc ribbon